MSLENLTDYTYTFGGSLSADNPTYVKRKADEQLYHKLKKGEFCYVLNSRQMGKSSLRVRTMQRLMNERIDCLEIDLTQIGNNLSKNEWYASIAFLIVMSFQALSLDEFNNWWEQRKELSPLQNLTDLFSNFILKLSSRPIIFFVDEIDNILDLEFSLDDFFAFIRYCYNHRVDNPDYNRLTFCLLGVATPSELIQKKHITPFNIGTGVELTGLTPEEAIPILSPGLASVVDHPEQLLTEVLYWTGGQPFLTQKLCRLIVENSASFLSNGNISNSLAGFVQSQIIENWESKDQPEHLKTIRDRVIKRSEQRASYLLELYQKIWQSGEVTAKSTPEEAELQLSGLVVNRQGKLQVYNPIYREVFNDKWIEVELASLHPYSESFRGWIASGEQDKSRLLRGKALEEAENWAEGKELSYQDKQFLAASRQQKIQEETEELERQAQLERERKDKEAAEQVSNKLAEANQKYKQRIRLGSIIFAIALLGAVGTFVFSGRRINTANNQVKNAQGNIEEIQEQLGNAEQQLEKMEETAEEKKNEAESAEKRANQSQQELQNKQRELEVEQNQLQEAQDKINASRKENQRLSQEAKRLKQETQFAKNEAKNAQEDAANATEKAQTAQATADKINLQVAKANELIDRGTELNDKGQREKAQEVWGIAALSFKLPDDNLKQALLNSTTSLVYQDQAQLEEGELDQNKLREAKEAIQASLNFLEKNKINDSVEKSQILVHAYFTRGQLHQLKKESQEAVQFYKKAVDILNLEGIKLLNQGIPILTESQFPQPSNIKSLTLWESAYLQYMKLLNESHQESVRMALIALQDDNLEYLLKSKQWEDADNQTYRLMVVEVKREDQGWLDMNHIRNFNCDTLRRIDQNWLKYSDKRFGFSVQREIFEVTGNNIGRYNEEAWKKFLKEVGRSYEERDTLPRGYLPGGHARQYLKQEYYSDGRKVEVYGYWYTIAIWRVREGGISGRATGPDGVRRRFPGSWEVGRARTIFLRCEL